MSKNDNKELNAILEQLKKSYSGDDNLENSEAEESDDDFQKMLSNYFSDDDSNKDIYKFTASEDSGDLVNQQSEYSLADFEEFTVEQDSFEDVDSEEIVEVEEKTEDSPIVEETVVKVSAAEEIFEEESTEEVIEEVIEEESVFEEIIEDGSSLVEEIIQDELDDEVLTEEPIEEESYAEELDDKAIVDDVFAAMFPSVNSSKSAYEELEIDFNENPLERSVHTEHISRMFDLDETFDDCDNADVVDMPQQSDAYEFLAEDVTIIDPDTDSSSDEVPVIFEECSQNQESIQEPLPFNEIADEHKETIDDIIGDMDLDDEEDIVLDISAILTDDDDLRDDTVESGIDEAEEHIYLSDPLQGHLSDAAFVSYKISADEVNFDIEAEAPELDDEEISLLLDFGYDDEAEAEAGRDRTNEIKRRTNCRFHDESNNKIYGYCGEEYTHKLQNSHIREKYARDKKELFIKTAVVFSISVILFFMSLVNCFGASVNYFLYSLIEIAALAIVSVIGWSELKEGVVGLTKLESNTYSAPAVVMAATLLYDLFSAIYVIVAGGTIFNGVLLPCGFFASTYVFAIILSEFLECLAEAKAFDVVADASDLYTAEMLNKGKKEIKSFDKQIGKSLFSGEFSDNQTFEVRKTSIPNGYFSRMSQKQIRLSGSFYLIGGIFVLSLIMGLVALVKEGSMAMATYTSMVIILMGMPISFSLVYTLPKLASSIALKEKNCAIVGDNSSEEYSNVDILVFDDRDAIEVVDKIEIRPEADSDLASAMRIAARAFKALGGPISAVVADKITDEDGEKPPIISVQSLKDNGIEFYMDSSIYMLIGDAAFMSTFGIRVSSDRDVHMSGDASKHNNVIYIAIDGVPRLGYVIHSKISDAFAALVVELDKYGVRSAVASYDPTVNDYYFEQNKIYGVANISAYKPEHFYNRQADAIADGGIFSCNDAKDIIYPLIEARKLHHSKKMNRIINYMASVIGCFVSVMFVIFALLENLGGNLNFITLTVISLFQIASAALIIFNSFDFKRKREKVNE